MVYNLCLLRKKEYESTPHEIAIYSQLCTMTQLCLIVPVRSADRAATPNNAIIPTALSFSHLRHK